MVPTLPSRPTLLIAALAVAVVMLSVPREKEAPRPWCGDAELHERYAAQRVLPAHGQPATRVIVTPPRESRSRDDIQMVRIDRPVHTGIRACDDLLAALDHYVDCFGDDDPRMAAIGQLADVEEGLRRAMQRPGAQRRDLPAQCKASLAHVRARTATACR